MKRDQKNKLHKICDVKKSTIRVIKEYVNIFSHFYKKVCTKVGRNQWTMNNECTLLHLCALTLHRVQ